MKNFTDSQLKALSEFLNTVAAAWFSAGIISPLFVQPENIARTLTLILLATLMTGGFLGSSLYVIRKVKI